MRFLMYTVIVFLAVSAPVYAQQNSPVPAGPAQAVTPHITPKPASTAPLPAGVQGVWSAPDCETPQALLVLSARHQLSFRGGRYNINHIESWRGEDYDGDMLYFYLTNDARGYFFKMTNDGLIRHRVYLVHPGQMLMTAWSRALEKLAMEYSRCTKLFSGTPVVTQEDVNLPFRLDEIHDSCAGVDPDGFNGAAACQDTIFRTLDTNSDQNLDRAELTGFYRQAGFLENAMPAGCAPRQADLTPDKTAENFADEVLSLADTGGNAALDMAEVKAVFGNPLARPALEPLETKLRHARSILRFLPLSDAERHCTAASLEMPAFTGTITVPQPSPLSLDAPGGGCGCGGG